SSFGGKMVISIAFDYVEERKVPPCFLACQGSPVNTYDFIIVPLLKSLAYDVPKISINVSHTLLLSRFFWLISMLIYPWLKHQWVPGPLILPAEVFKIGVTHYFSYLKAREELGYVPMVSPQEGLSMTIAYWKERKRREIDRPHILYWISIIAGMSALFYAAYLPLLQPLRWLNFLHLLVFRSLSNIRLVFWLAVAAHFGEAIYVLLKARRLDPANARGWFLQTVILGFPSTNLFNKRARQV
ncbi:hypothetical protein HPP92_028084, partial [Vanilla planifolia]